MKLGEKNQIKIAQILPCDLIEMPKKAAALAPLLFHYFLLNTLSWSNYCSV
jgi:hypothetical protein